MRETNLHEGMKSNIGAKVHNRPEQAQVRSATADQGQKQKGQHTHTHTQMQRMHHLNIIVRYCSRD